MSAPTAQQLRDFPALGLSESAIVRVSDPNVDQILSVRASAANLSPAAYDVIFLREGIDRARETGAPARYPVWLVDEMLREWETSDNADRREYARLARLGVDPKDPLQPGPEELHEDGRSLPAGRSGQDVLADVERMKRGGSLVGTVEIHNDRHDWDTVVIGVPVHFSALEILEITLEDVTYAVCWFCGEAETDANGDVGSGLIAWILAVSCGGVLRAFPTCRECRRRALEQACEGGLHFIHVPPQ